ncbi:MAG: hypothetical protein ACREBR_01730 [bacterium]
MNARWDHFDRNVNGHIKIRNLKKWSASEDTCPMPVSTTTSGKEEDAPALPWDEEEDDPGTNPVHMSTTTSNT